jgi:abequosyltransferase
MKLSIGIPTYNGSKTIAMCLNSIIPQIVDGVEIVISDNASTDNNREIINEYEKKYSFIHCYYNSENVGMDANFDLVVKRSMGQFVWILSDDDYITNSKAINIILDLIFNHSTSSSFFVNYENDVVPINKDYYDISGSEFFRITKFKSTLISSTIVNKYLWDNLDKSMYYGTYWIHIVYLIVANANNTSCIVNEVMVEQIKYQQDERRWGKDGTFFTVGIELAKLYYNLNMYHYDVDVCKLARRYIKDKNIWNIPIAKKHGLVVTKKLLKDCISVFWIFPTFWLMDLPLLITPKIFYKPIFFIYHFFKDRKHVR